MYKKYSSTIVFILIIIFGALLRFVDLAQVPSTLNRDEAALAYNAYLLRETGKDEWGRVWPTSLESFGDYKLPGYPLLLVASYSLLGVNDFAVRFPSAVAGTILIAVAFSFSRKVLKLSSFASLCVAALVAIQPIFFFYSRMAWEANVALLFFTIGVTLVLSRAATQRNNWKSDILSLFFFLLAIFTYNTPLLLLPFIGLAIIWKTGITKVPQWLFPVLGMAVIFMVGLFSLRSISAQKSSITIFSDETVWRESVQYYESFSGISQTLFGNRYVFFAKLILTNVTESFSPLFIIIRGGGHPWHTVPNAGHIYAAVYVLFILALIWLVFTILNSRRHPKSLTQPILLFFLLITSLAPAVITVDAPHATRSLFFFFLICGYAGISLDWLLTVLRSRFHNKGSLKVLFVSLILLFSVTEVRSYFTKFFLVYPEQSATILKAGLDTELSKMEARLSTKADQVAVVDPDGFLYITAAWDLKMTPDHFYSTINHHLPDRIGLKYGYRVGRYRFIAKPQDRLPEDTHIIEWNSKTNRWVTDQL